MSEKLTAHFENREYFFKFIKRIAADRSTGASEEIHIDMYGTLYVFIKNEGKWVNKPGNKMNMVLGLIAAAVAALQENSI